AERRTGRKVTVAFNYRYAPIYERVKELLDAGTIGQVTSIDFHWYLDNIHGADYFRRWHAYIKNNGSLYVQKSTHHFDLLNWYIGTEPETVSAFADLKHYGRNGPFRGVRCKTCPTRASATTTSTCRRTPISRRCSRTRRRSTATTATPAYSARTSTCPTRWW